MRRLSWMLVPIALLACAPALAAPSAAPPAGPMEQRAQRIRSRVLREKVGLNDDKAQKVEVILNRYAPERRRLALQIRDGRQKIRALMTLNSEDQTAYKGALDEVRTGRKALQDLMEHAFADISKELSPKEQARLFLALDELKGKLGARRRQREAPDDESDG